MKKIIVLLFTIFSVSIWAQDPGAPSLQIGLGGLKLTKATPDVEVLAGLIADKQDQIKVKLVENMLLSRIDFCGSTVYGYVDNTLHSILAEKDETVRTKSVIENSVNLGFVYAYSDFFVRTVDPGCCTAFYDLAKIQGMNCEEMIMRSNSSGYDHLSLYNLRYCENVDKKESKDAVFLAEVGNSNILLEDRNQSADEFIAFILDLTAEAISKNERLKVLGLLQTHYSSSADSLSMYIRYQRECPELVAQIYSCLANQLNTLVGFAGYFSCANNIAEPVSRPISGKSDLEFTTFNANEIGLYLDSIETSLRDAVAKKELNAIRDSIDEDFNELIGVIQQLKLLNLNNFTPPAVSNAVFLIYNKALPSANRMKIYSERMFQISKQFTIVLKMLFEKTGNEINNLTCLKDKSNTGLITKLLGRLYNFDMTETYSDFSNALSGLIDLFPDADAQFTVRKIISFVRKYMVVQPGAQWYDAQITVNVVDFIESIQEIPYFYPRRTQLLFNIGLNNAYFFKNDVLLPDNTPIRNFSFAAEKIGVKYKIWDWKYSRSFGYGETFHLWNQSYVRYAPPSEPIVSNLHVLVYGSGLLYNIVNTGTSKNFEYPLVGTGVGLTFFNDLDFNVTWGIPILPNASLSTKYLYWGIGFDVSVSEYTRALQKKQQENKTERKEKEASKLKEDFIKNH